MAKKKDFSDQIRGYTVSQRIEAAKERIERLTERVIEVIDLSSVCDHFVYSSLLSGQIPRSYAGHAYATTQRALFQQLLIRTVALWDKPDSNAVSIPAVIELIDDEAVIHELQQEHFETHSGRSVRNLNPSQDPEIEAVILLIMKNSQDNFAASQAEKVVNTLRLCIEKVRDIARDDVHLSIINLRDHIAHSIDKTRREFRGPIQSMKYGQEKELLQTSIRLIEDLYCWVNGTSFDIQGDCVSDAKRNAEELWANCTFSVPAR